MMKLKLVKLRKSHMTSLVLSNPKGGPSFRWASIGDVVEVEDDLGYAFLADCPDMLELIKTRIRRQKQGDETIKEIAE
jgi:hypothetical protein